MSHYQMEEFFVDIDHIRKHTSQMSDLLVTSDLEIHL